MQLTRLYCNALGLAVPPRRRDRCAPDARRRTPLELDTLVNTIVDVVDADTGGPMHVPA